MRIGLVIRAVALTVVLAARLAGAAPVPEAIIAPANPSRLLDLASRELQRYWYLASGRMLPIGAQSGLPCFALGSPDQNPAIARLVAAGKLRWDPSALGDQGYVLKTVDDGGRRLTIAAGATGVGTLYAVYDLMGRYGFGFYLGGDALPPRGDPGFLDLNEVRTPALKIRGSLPWYNFLNSPTTWNLADHKRFYDQMAKMRMNFVGFHAYDYEPFCAVPIDGQYRYGQPLQTTSQSVWGTVPMKTSEFGFSTGDCFTREYFGADAAFGYDTPQQGIEQAQDVLSRGLAYARERGIHVCLGFEVSGDPSDPTVERDVVLRMRHVLQRYPMISYLWLWQSEGRGSGGNEPAPPRRTGLGNYYARTRHHFDYLQQPSRIAEAVRVSYFAHLGHNVLSRYAPGVRLIVSGWGGDRWMGFSDFYLGLDKTLPPDVVFAALDNIDPTAAPAVSHAYGEVSPGRERWPIPWFESDGGGTRRDQWGPQCNVLPFTALCRDALAKGSQGLLGIHWRSRGVEEVAAYVSEFAWDPQLSYEEFYDRFARRCFGPEIGPELSRVLCDLEALGPRWTGSHGQVECGSFWWFAGDERPLPENLQKLSAIEERLVALRARCPVESVDRLDYLLHMLRWVTKYDAAALRLLPGGPVETATVAAEAARASESANRADKAQAAYTALVSAGLGEAFNECAQLLTTRGDLGVLATANGKAYAAYRELQRRVAALADSPWPAEDTHVDALQLSVPVTPDRLLPGENLELGAIARTPHAPAQVSLHWRQMGAGDFRSVRFAEGRGATFQVSLDAASLPSPGGSSTTSKPETAPARPA